MPIIKNDSTFEDYKSEQDKQRERIILDGTTEFKLTLLVREIERLQQQIAQLQGGGA